MFAQGYRGYAGVKKQSAYTTFAPADDFARIASHSIAKTPEHLELDLIQNSRNPQVELLGNETSRGDLVFPLNLDDMFGLLMKDMLGAETFTALEAGTVGEHVFIPQAELGLPFGFSAEVTNDPRLIDNVFKGIGGHVNTINLTFEAGQIINVTANCDFFDFVKGAVDQTPVSYGPNGRYVLTHTGSRLLGNIPSHIVSGSLVYGAGLTMDRFGLSDKRPIEAIPGMYAITGEVVIRFENLQHVNEFLAGEPSSIELFFAGDTVGTTVLGITFSLDNIFWRGQTPVGTGTGEQMLTLPFVSKSGVSSTLARVTLTNTVAAAY